MEQWKDIQGYEGLYQVSNEGRVRGLDRNINSPHESTRRIRGKVLIPKKCTKGRYLQQAMCKEGIVKYILIHRMVAFAFIEGYFEGAEVNHINGDRYNNSVDNLEWCHRSYNIQHSYNTGLRIGTVLTREQCHLSKLSSEEAQQVIELRLRGVPYKQIAEQYSMSVSGLEKIITKYKKEQHEQNLLLE